MTDPTSPGYTAHVDQVHAAANEMSCTSGALPIVRSQPAPGTPCGKAGCPWPAVVTVAIFYGNGNGSTMNTCAVDEPELMGVLTSLV